MLILPLIVMVVFAFVFQDTLAGISSAQARITCPWPSQSGLWNSSGTLMYANATYNYPNVNNQTLTLTCTEVHTPDDVDYYYGTGFDLFGFGVGIPMGAFFYVGDLFSSFFDRVAAFFEMIVLFFVLPSEVTGIAWFGYVQFVLVLLPIVALVMIIRGNT